jgi:hypothetical protein
MWDNVIDALQWLLIIWSFIWTVAHSAWHSRRRQ